MDEFQPIVKLTDSMREMYQSMHQVTQRAAEACGSTRIQYLTLYKLKLFPMIKLNELAEHLHTNASTASGIVERLVQSGLIVRETSQNDRRAVRLRLSEQGEELLQKTNETIMKRLSPLLTLPEQEMNELIRIQRKIIAILQQVREES